MFGLEYFNKMALFSGIPEENLSGPERTALPTDVSFGNSDWQDEPDLNFTFTIDASTFTSGTEGQPIALRLGSSGRSFTTLR